MTKSATSGGKIYISPNLYITYLVEKNIILESGGGGEGFLGYIYCPASARVNITYFAKENVSYTEYNIMFDL